MTDHSSTDNILRAAEYQAAQYRERKPLDLMTQPFAPQTIAEAYAVQRAFVQQLVDMRGQSAGYKVAYTSAVMRQRSGVSQACYGYIPSGMVHTSPAALHSKNYEGIGIECEVAVMLRADIPPSAEAQTRESVSDAIEWLAPAFEVVDRRDAPYLDGQLPEIRTIVANISNGGAVYGDPVTDWRSIDLAASRGVMRINGEIVGEGHGSDVLGHPLEPLAWLANTLSACGESLTAGTLILTGSFAPPAMLSPGDNASVSIDGLGEARLSVQ